MKTAQAEWQGSKAARCPHPADQVVMGNDRMEMVCILCGQPLPLDAALDDYSNAPNAASADRPQ
jgi:hypothetical protein